MVYLGNDGRLRAELWNGAHAPIATAQRVDDQQWHHMVLVKRADRQQLYVDGAFVGQIAGPAPADWAAFMQLGTGFTYLWPETNGSWFPFRGELRDVIVARRAWEADEVSRDFLESRSVPTGSHTTSP
jgi:hypothetical protein